MESILLVVLVVVTLVMIGLVLLQRSEGGALGIGGPGAMFSTRGSANFLTRATAALAAAFMMLSLVLAILSGGGSDGGSVMEDVVPPVAPEVTPLPEPDLSVAPGIEPEIPDRPFVPGAE